MFRRLNHCAVPGFAPICMDSNDPKTVECAFKQRLMRDVPEANPVWLSEFTAFVHDYVQRFPCVRVLDFEEWLASTTYNESRKNELRQAYDRLGGGRPTKHQCSHIDTFVKTEFYPTWKHARMINSRCDAFKVWSGPMFKAIEDVVYAEPEFIKHIPVPERPAVISAMKHAGSRYFATDFTAFESHFVPALLEACECQLYRHCLQNYPEDVEWLCAALKGKNRMRTRTGVSATVRGRRMSGDMCTSLGNGFTNLMLAKFLAHKHGGSLSGFVEGDDGLFETDFELLASDYAKLGFTIKVEEVDDPCSASFCGLICAQSGQIIRDPIKFCMGFGWTHSCIGGGARVMDELLRAKALSTVYETGQCPIVGAIARYALSVTTGVVPRFINDGYHIPHDMKFIPAFNPSPDTRELFSHLFGISVSCQLMIEEAARVGDFNKVASLLPSTVEQSTYVENYVVIT